MYVPRLYARPKYFPRAFKKPRQGCRVQCWGAMSTPGPTNGNSPNPYSARIFFDVPLAVCGLIVLRTHFSLAGNGAAALGGFAVGGRMAAVQGAN